MTVLGPHGKVFGLGLSKTGTSSLAEALNRLGIKTIHYPHDERTHEQLWGGDYDLDILREYRGVTDITVAPYFAQLDRAWPGSKFILTVREKEAWLRSAEVHWRLMLEGWDKQPQFRRFTEFICACVYGSVGFSRVRLSYAYDAHVRNVRHYFRDRPTDLLIMDICVGEGWEKLCPFLGLDTPAEPFPHAFRWMHPLLEAKRDAAEVIPPGETFILVDQGGFGREFAAGRRCLRFNERDGTYWGPPADDQSAMGELQRLSGAGAAFVVFGWPAFWWLDYYSGLHGHLRSNHRCVLRNDRLIIFDLRPTP